MTKFIKTSVFFYIFISSINIVAQKQSTITLDYGVITDTAFFQSLDSLMKKSKYYNDPLFMFSISYMADNGRTNYATENNQIRDSFYLEYFAIHEISGYELEKRDLIKYNNKFLLFPKLLRNIIFKAIGKKTITKKQKDISVKGFFDRIEDTRYIKYVNGKLQHSTFEEAGHE